METQSPIPPLRPNYTASDFEVGQSVLLRCDGSAGGVPLYMAGHRAAVIRTTSRRLRVRVSGGACGAHRELSVTPNQIALIVAE